MGVTSQVDSISKQNASSIHAHLSLSLSFAFICLFLYTILCLWLPFCFLSTYFNLFFFLLVDKISLPNLVSFTSHTFSQIVYLYLYTDCHINVFNVKHLGNIFNACWKSAAEDAHSRSLEGNFFKKWQEILLLSK